MVLYIRGLLQADVQRQASTNDDFSSRNGHVSSKQYNDRSGYNGGKWFNEKRNNNRRSDDLRSKGDFNYREQSSGRNAGNSGNSKVNPLNNEFQLIPMWLLDSNKTS